ncbi:hypothetical protein Y1Q_0019069 [Alligator mississippiensis]|uniref:Uncharacterized protein n=1 Tax=Alligator mississippiensis TaxID=8496 RepID=A0A151N0Z3_ALLMI|nr:hypothetical protein Y1Q_0019069 [Alligator mississippiensis]
MSIDYPDTVAALRSPATSNVVVTKSAHSIRLPSPPVDRSTQTTIVAPSAASPYLEIQDEKPQECQRRATELPAPPTHLFSHLPLHSQQQAKTPYGQELEQRCSSETTDVSLALVSKLIVSLTFLLLRCEKRREGVMKIPEVLKPEVLKF